MTAVLVMQCSNLVFLLIGIGRAEKTKGSRLFWVKLFRVAVQETNIFSRSYMKNA